MVMVEKGWQRKFPQCGRPGTMVLEEPEHDASGKHSRWIGATGCWQAKQGKLIHKCGNSDA